MLGVWITVGVTLFVAAVGWIILLFNRLRTLEKVAAESTTAIARLAAIEKATAELATNIARLEIKTEPGWASVVERARLQELHKPEAKYERRDLLIKHRLAGSATPEEIAELLGLFAGVIVDPLASPTDRINASAAVIAMRASDVDTEARVEIARLPRPPI